MSKLNYPAMAVKFLIWVRNLMLVLFVAQLGYFLYQKLYKGMDVEWNFIAPAVALFLLQLAISKPTAKE